ncbi:4'-phosphopantetheinyl transferase family protein [Siccirubricoccus phaeus]|uniref:4'-phosphopantetheinyl transferase family protein n=1 Tax=Siccirubricoccus phaeus TaxID=2595053 RepID=UPI00165A2D8A|nr:4'-phosphopantetheinyl transferase superfamily protein [Siccirubricoccus phaeus]
MTQAAAAPLRVAIHWRFVGGCGRPAFDAAALTAEERAAACRFLRPADAALWLESRFLLRTTLAARLGVAPDRLTFRRSRHGKPALDGLLRFNLSHAGGLALLAVAEDRLAELGIDVERADRPVTEALIRAATAPAEAAALLALPEARRGAAFLELWTRKESLLKAAGCGLSQPVRAVALDPRDGRLLALPPALGRPEEHRLLKLALPAPYLAVLAVRDPLRRPVLPEMTPPA